MEVSEQSDESNISRQFVCQRGDLPNIFIDSVYLCVTLTAVCLNILVLTGLHHVSYTFNSKKFLEIRRSHNREHPRFILRSLQYSKSVKATCFKCSNDGDSSLSKNEKGFVNRASAEFTLPRSPSCPDRMCCPSDSRPIFTNNSRNYWLNKTNLARRRTPTNSPQSRARLSTALYLVYSLTIADLLNASVTLLNLLLALWRPSYAFMTVLNETYQVKAVEPCVRLLLTALLCMSYNASLCSTASLMLDLYLGVARSMRYHMTSRNSLRWHICGFWGFAVFLGSLHIILPAIQPQDTNYPIYKRFLLPNEPCTIARNLAQENFCLLKGTANSFRSGHATGVLLFICVVMMVSLCVLSLRKVRRDSLKRTRTMRIMAAHRSASLPTINRAQGAAINVRTVNFNEPKKTPLCTGRNLLRSTFTLLSLSSLYIAVLVPSLLLDAYFILTGRLQKLPSWTFDLFTHMPVFMALFNPIIYSLRLSDIHVGLRKFKKRLLGRTERAFVRQQLRFHRDRILVGTKSTDFRIRLTPKNTVRMRELK